MNTQPPINTQETSINAGKLIELVINRDQDYPDLANLLNGACSDSYIKPLLNPDEEFVQTNQVPIPKRFFDMIVDSETQCRCFMGLLPEIGRAWITIDCNLYIWSLTDESDYYEYSDQDQIIIKAALVKPKANVFGDHIKHVLVISTPLQVILLAVATNQTPSGSNSISLFATNLTMPADDEQMVQIGGTDDGRIFMVGKAGSLYEVNYTKPKPWPSTICNLSNKSESSYMSLLPPYVRHYLSPKPEIRSFTIDNERNVLYLLHHKTNAIEVVYLGDSYSNYKSIFTFTNIKNMALQQCRQQNRVFSTSDFDIESLHVISKAESKRIHLMALTVSGIRLYFSHFKDAFRQVYGFTLPNAPNTLELGHVRMPPPVIPRPAGQLVTTYVGSYYDCGICVSICPKTGASATLRVSSVTASKSPAATLPPSSTIGMSTLPNPTYAETDIAIDVKESVQCVTESNPHLAGRHYIKEISQLWSEAPRQFIVLTSLSVLFYSKLRPVDILYRILSKAREDPDTTLMQSFFERYGQVESCAMCLSIVCASDEADIVRKATDTFLTYGGLPTSTLPTMVQGNHLGRATGQTDVVYSGKHDGFVLYFARIVSPVWKLKVFAVYGIDMNAHIAYNQIQTTVSNTKVNLILLRDFLDRNPKFHEAVGLSDPRYHATDRNLALLESHEQKSAHDFYLMLTQCIEALAFFEFLFDSNVHQIISTYLDESHRANIYNLDISTILTTPQGRELTRELVISSITKYGSGDSQYDFDFVSKQLGRFCNSFFGSNDISFFKGVEYIHRAVHDDSDYERIESLKNSLASFKEAAASISDAKLGSICNVYTQTSFHIGILELALERAREVDPKDLAVLAFESPASKNEINSNLLTTRLNSYRYALLALEDVQLMSKNGVPPGRVPIPALSAYADNVIETAFRSKDKIFHYQLYAWFMEQGLENKLLTCETPYLIPYFEKFITDQQKSLQFLATYHMQKQEYLEATKCLRQLASLPSSSLPLAARLDYISTARVCAQCGKIDGYNLEEMGELAAIQNRIREAIESECDDSPDARQAVHELDLRLYNYQEMKQLFGPRFPSLNGIFNQIEANSI